MLDPAWPLDRRRRRRRPVSPRSAAALRSRVHSASACAALGRVRIRYASRGAEVAYRVGERVCGTQARADSVGLAQSSGSRADSASACAALGRAIGMPRAAPRDVRIRSARRTGLGRRMGLLRAAASAPAWRWDQAPHGSCSTSSGEASSRKCGPHRSSAVAPCSRWAIPSGIELRLTGPSTSSSSSVESLTWPWSAPASSRR